MSRTAGIIALLWVATLVFAEDPPAHHAGKKFVNPYVEREHGGFFGIVRARLSDEWLGYDAERDIVPTQSHEIASTTSAEEALVTWVGHATVLIQYRGINVLTDPMFSQFASPVSFAGPRRITQPAIPVAQLPPIHAVVISHDHYDHLDTASIKALGDEPQYYVPLGIKDWMVNKGIAPEKVTELDWWQSHQLIVDEVALEIAATPAQHFSGRSLFNRDQTLWSSWSIAWSDFRVWFGGDTGYNPIQFKEIGERLGPFDLGIIPIGAYKPRWFMGAIHVDPAEAVKIHQDIEAKQSFGMHWGAFVLAGEGVLTPPIDLSEALDAAGIARDEFVTYAVGETRTFAPAR